MIRFQRAISTEWQLNLNLRTAQLCDRMAEEIARLRIGVHASACGTRLIDCGIVVPGGLEAGRRLAEICLAGLVRVDFVPSAAQFSTGLAVMVTTDFPVEACMASQYAGWQVANEKFFAMGSGPMRAVGNPSHRAPCPLRPVTRCRAR